MSNYLIVTNETIKIDTNVEYLMIDNVEPLMFEYLFKNSKFKIFTLEISNKKIDYDILLNSLIESKNMLIGLYIRDYIPKVNNFINYFVNLESIFISNKYNENITGLFSSINSCLKLKLLSLQNINMSEVTKLPPLEELRLVNNNKFHKKFNINVKKLSIRDNIITFNFKYANIIYLEIANTKLTSRKLKNILQNKYEILILSNTGIRDKSVKYISNYLRRNTKLTYLDLEYNKITFDGVKKICDNLYFNKSVKYLNLFGNKALMDYDIELIDYFLEVLKYNGVLWEIEGVSFNYYTENISTKYEEFISRVIINEDNNISRGIKLREIMEGE